MEEGSSLSGIISLLWLIALHATIALAYAALTNARRTTLREQAETGNRRARLAADLVESDSSRLHITYQISTFLLNFSIAVVATIYVAQPWITGANTPGLVYAAVLLPAACLGFILGELVPAAVGQAHAERLALLAVYPMRLLIFVLGPVVVLLIAMSRIISAVFQSEQAVNSITEEEILTMVDAGQKGGTIESEEKEMIYSVLQLDQTVVREVMVPRIDIIALEVNTPVKEALGTFIKSGFSRIPVFEDSIDNIKGLLYAKDLLSVWRRGDSSENTRIQDLLRPAYFVPETKKAGVLLKELQNQNIHMAMVVDEYGGTAGLVTIENLIEEIIGDIRDEYDINEEAEYVQHGPDEFTADASMDIDDFNELLDSELPTEENDTLGGFIYSHLGRVPRAGDTIEHSNLLLRVELVEGRRIRKVRVKRRLEQQTPSVPAAPEHAEADSKLIPAETPAPTPNEG
ncbi:MAG: HlyC/CorC family transporter [Chloroflexi bacterium]|nr:HlyC/CorC family transporter [Chloroflexota bacterium]